MMTLGCDFHTSYQTIGILDEATGELTERAGDQPSKPHMRTPSFFGCSAGGPPFRNLRINAFQLPSGGWHTRLSLNPHPRLRPARRRRARMRHPEKPGVRFSGAEGWATRPWAPR